MRKILILFLQTCFATVLPVSAQIESPNTTTELDATWTDIHEPSAQSDGDLHLSGKSKVDFTLKNKTKSRGYADIYSYQTSVEIRDKYGATKAAKYYQVQYLKGKTTWSEVNRYGGFIRNLGSGLTLKSSLSIGNGETGDVIFMSIYNSHGGLTTSVILTTLSSTTTRYDLYDYLPLFGSDSGLIPTSNRIKDHNKIIDVYVHRKIMGHGTWGTLCLPFDMTDRQVKKSLGDNVVYSEFYNVDLNGKIINFHSTHGGMKAGKPYLIQNNGETIENFFADDVKFTQNSVKQVNEAGRKSMKESSGYYFVGLLEPTKVNEGEHSFNPNGRAVYIAIPALAGEKQQLKRLSANGHMNAFRAYLVFPEAAFAGAKPMMEMSISLDNILDNSTAVTKILVDGKPVNNNIYDLQGCYMGNDASLLPHGVYIRNGKKFCK